MKESENKIQFKSLKEVEDYLDKHYVNKVVQFNIYTPKGKKTIAGKVESMAYDMATKNPPVVIIILNEAMRYEIEKDEFFSTVKLLN